ncbi:hypothetical protein [Subsaximicrobium wynnwilliamsii]|uniref:hypothetical protein n=1 Tax=Subsaximicrobium wynnwilliamsii TaxID=291179 RepID=UPI00167AAF8A|nr:hypothetical protein [Subsaximicrobium wynnwilliamsii]
MQLLNEFLEFELLSIGSYSLKISTLVLVLVIILFTKMILWVIKKSIFRRKNPDRFR